MARNSHSNWATPGLKKRIYGVANDVAGSDGEQKQITWEEMTPAREIDYPGCCHVYSGLRPQPTPPPMSDSERMYRGKEILKGLNQDTIKYFVP